MKFWHMPISKVSVRDKHIYFSFKNYNHYGVINMSAKLKNENQCHINPISRQQYLDGILGPDPSHDDLGNDAMVNKSLSSSIIVNNMLCVVSHLDPLKWDIEVLVMLSMLLWSGFPTLFDNVWLQIYQQFRNIMSW